MSEKQTSNALVIFVEKIEATTNQLLRDIRKLGNKNVSYNSYFKDFKNLKRQLESQQLINQLLASKIFDLIKDQNEKQCQVRNQSQQVTKTIITDQPLKLVLKRQLVRIHSHKTKCEQIYRFLSRVELLEELNTGIKNIKQQKIIQQTQEIYASVFDQVKDIINIIDCILAALSSHKINPESSYKKYEKISKSSDNQCRSALTNIIKRMYKDNKLQKKIQISSVRQSVKEIRASKALQTKFNIFESQQSQTIPVSVNDTCVACLLF